MESCRLGLANPNPNPSPSISPSPSPSPNPNSNPNANPKQVDSVAEFGVDVAALSAQGLDALENHGYGYAGNGMWSSVHPLPALEPMFQSEVRSA